MSDALPLDGMNGCGCCSGTQPESPLVIFNRPGLDRILYRIGDHARFKRSMMTRLSSPDHAALANLRTRDDDDFTIALLDAVATMGDVLTFYQERIANETYLRTATERRSVLEMARLIGYQLSPGVAAEVDLAFTVDELATAPESYRVDEGVKVQSVPGQDETAQVFETVESFVARPEWNALRPALLESVSLDQGTQPAVWFAGTATLLSVGDALLFAGDDDWRLRFVTEIELDTDRDWTRVELDKRIGDLGANATVHAMRTRARLFGHNAPDPRMLEIDSTLHDGPNWNDFDTESDRIELDGEYPGIVDGSWLVLVKGGGGATRFTADRIAHVSMSAFAVSGKSTRVIATAGADLSGHDRRVTTVYAESEALPIVQPIVNMLARTLKPVRGKRLELSTFDANLVAGQRIAVSGPAHGATGDDDPVYGQVVEIAAVEISPDGRTALELTQRLTPPDAGEDWPGYDRASVTINANVVRATHGETVAGHPGVGAEILGSGDARQAYQSFTLAQPPLTHTSAATPSGAESSLTVRVDGVRWHEVDTLYERDADERIFISRLNDDGTTTVRFGDGASGTRLPTGAMNVTASYRAGIGADGNVAAKSLSQLMTRPLGLSGVVNMQAAEGGADAESLDDARDTAPITVLTLDRAVSLRDYEDFARAFAGVAKATADWVHVDGHRRVFVTIAGADGAKISASSNTFANLLDALRGYGDPHIPVDLASYRPQAFRIAASVWVDDDHITANVIEALEVHLATRFSFAERELGQSVHLSEIVAVAHEVDGVIGLDVDELYRTTQSPSRRQRLVGHRARVTTTEKIRPATLLYLDPGHPDHLEAAS